MVEQQLWALQSEVNATFRQRLISGRAAVEMALNLAPFKGARLSWLARVIALAREILGEAFNGFRQAERSFVS